jgi:hypothetical protein
VTNERERNCSVDKEKKKQGENTSLCVYLLHARICFRGFHPCLSFRILPSHVRQGAPYLYCFVRTHNPSHINRNNQYCIHTMDSWLDLPNHLSSIHRHANPPSQSPSCASLIALARTLPLHHLSGSSFNMSPSTQLWLVYSTCIWLQPGFQY